jgi:hypothetical protein
MPLGFRKSFRLAAGVRLSLGKRSADVSRGVPSRMEAGRLAALMGAAIAATALMGPARAERRATKTEGTDIVAATKAYLDAARCCNFTRIRVERVRVSTVDRRWAIIDFYKYNFGSGYGPGEAALHRGFLTGRWSVQGFAMLEISGTPGCKMPPPVRRDLGVHC